MKFKVKVNIIGTKTITEINGKDYVASLFEFGLCPQLFIWLGLCPIGCVCFKFIKFILRNNIPWNIKMRILFQGI